MSQPSLRAQLERADRLGHQFSKICVVPDPATEDRAQVAAGYPWIQRLCSTCQEHRDLGLHAQLAIGQPGDPYEVEADTVAEQVMSMPQPPVQQGGEIAAQIHSPHQLFHQMVQHQARQALRPGPDLEDRLAQSKGNGSPLPDAVQAFMGPRLGVDLSPVRVHMDAESGQMNQELGAQAFAYGPHIYYGAGNGPANDHLTAHELTHTIQQGAVGRAQASPPAASPFLARSEETQPESESDQGASELGLVEAGMVELVRGVSPTVAELIERGPTALLEEEIGEGLDAFIEQVSGGIDIQAIVAEVMTAMQGLAEVIRSGDTGACAFLGERLEGLKQFVDEFFASQTFELIDGKLAELNQQAAMVSTLVLEPAFETVMGILGDRFARVSAIFDAVRSAGATIQSLGTTVWEWVCDYLGIEVSGEGGLTEWLMQKAQQVWETVSAELEPLKEPLSLLSQILVMSSPFGALILIKEGLPPLVEGIQWLLAHRDDPNLIATAREELGETWLPLLLERLDWLNTQLDGSLESILGPLDQVQTLLSDRGGVLSGIGTSLTGWVQSLGEVVDALSSWVSETWTSIGEAIGELSSQAWEAIRPLLAVLSSLTFAIMGFPGTTFLAAIGWGWTLLCDSVRVQILELFLHTALQALGAVQLPGVLGLVQPAVARFFESLQTRLETDQEGVLLALDNLAMIMAGANPEFLLGFGGGLVVGVIEGILDPLLLIWDILSLTMQIQMWAMSLAAGQVGNAVDLARQIGVDAITDATDEAAAHLTPEILQRFAELADRLAPIASGLQDRFMPTIESLMTGEGMTFEQMMLTFGTMWEVIEAGLVEQADDLANGLIDTMQSKEGLSPSTGYTLGWLAGTILVQVVATFCSFGTVEAVLGTSKAARLVIDAIKVADSLVGEALSLLGRFADEVIQMIGTLMGKLGDLARGALGEVFELAFEGFDEIKRFVDDLVELLFKGSDEAADVVEDIGDGARHADDIVDTPKAPREPEAPESRTPEVDTPRGDTDTPGTDSPDIRKPKDTDSPEAETPKDGSEPDTDPDRKKDTDDTDPDKKKDDEDDTDEKRAARQAATEAWGNLRAYTASDLRSEAEMRAKLAAQDSHVLGARISYDLEESGQTNPNEDKGTWSVEATALGEVGDTAKRDAGSGWIARDGNAKFYGETSATADNKRVIGEIFDELDARWKELCHVTEPDMEDKLRADADRLAREKQPTLKYDALHVEPILSEPEFTQDSARIHVIISIAPNITEDDQTLSAPDPKRKRLDELSNKARADLNQEEAEELGTLLRDFNIFAAPSGTARHKAIAWRDYKARKKEEEKVALSYDTWTSRYYEPNLGRAKKANEVVDQVHQHLNCGGDREVTVPTFGGNNRRHDIADSAAKWAKEVKKGNITSNLDIQFEIEMDEWLVTAGWTIEWIIIGTISQSLKDRLGQAGIGLRVVKDITEL